MRPMGLTRFVGLTGILAGCGLLLSAAVGRPQSAPAQPALPTVLAAPALLQAMAPIAPLLPVSPVAPVAPRHIHFAAPGVPEPPAPPALLTDEMPSMAGPNFAGPEAVEAFGTREHSDRVSDCSDLHINFDGGPAVMETEERSVSKAEASTLRIDNLQNAGVQFRGWDKDNYSVTLCKFADRDRNDSKELLSQIKMSIDGGRVSISGPGHEHNWAVHLLVSTPRGANLDIQSKNGPVSFSEVDGKIFVRATNLIYEFLGG